MRHNIGVIGERNQVLAFKSIGAHVAPAEDAAQAGRILAQMVRDGYAVVLISEDLAKSMHEAIDSYRQMPFPAILPIPTAQGATGDALEMIRKNAERAVGADILFSQGKDER